MPTTRVLATREASPALLSALRRLLDDAFDGDFSDDDWDHTLGGWHVVVSEGERPVAHAAVIPRVLEVDGHRLAAGYVEGVATAADRRNRGLGSLAMTELASVLRARFGFGALGTGRYGFYGRLGWERWQGPTFVYRGGQQVRTEEEDAAIMVLRFGPTRHLRLDAPLACWERPGDDW